MFLTKTNSKLIRDAGKIKLKDFLKANFASWCNGYVFLKENTKEKIMRVLKRFKALNLIYSIQPALDAV